MSTIINGIGRVGIRNYTSITPSQSYLLDTYGGAAVGYSLRKLSSTYTGSAIRVRRSSDNAEQNIGFDGSGNLDTTTLLAFVGAGNGFVTTWYDQSGNSLNATQTTATSQPTIVASGVVNTQNTKPSLKADGGDFMEFNMGATSNPLSIFSCAKISVLGGYMYEWSLGRTGWSSAYQCYSSGYTSGGNNYFLWQGSGVFADGVLSTNTFYLKTIIHSTGATKHFFYKNNIAQTVSNYASNISSDGIGRLFADSYPSAGQAFNGNHSEIIFYKSDQTSNVNNINTAINSYYSIY